MIKRYKGQHESLMDQVLWDSVQSRLDLKRQGTKTIKPRMTEESFLKGKRFDDKGDGLTKGAMSSSNP